MSKKNNTNTNTNPVSIDTEKNTEQLEVQETVLPPAPVSQQRCWRCGARQIVSGLCQNCGEHYDQ